MKTLRTMFDSVLVIAKNPEDSRILDTLASRLPAEQIQHWVPDCFYPYTMLEIKLG